MAVKSGFLTGAIAFAVLADVSSQVLAFDFYHAAINKEIDYLQTTTMAPVTPTPILGRSTAYLLDSVLFENADGPSTVNSATWTGPAGHSHPLTYYPGTPDFVYESFVSSQTALDSTSFPDGNFSISASTAHYGIQTFALTITGDRYVAAPHVTDFSVLQSFSANVGQYIYWSPSNLVGTPSYIECDIYHNGSLVLSTPLPGQTGVLSGTATQFLIPADTLAANSSYTGEIVFVDVSAIDQHVPTANVYGAYVVATSFQLHTNSTPVITPGLSDATSDVVTAGSVAAVPLPAAGASALALLAVLGSIGIGKKALRRFGRR
jgi:hypothetical protein